MAHETLVTAAMVGVLGIAAVSAEGDAPAPAEAMPALPRAPPPTPRPTADQWTARQARLTAVRVDLESVGSHTHANWVIFRLPFDSTDTHRVRDVRVTPSAAIYPDVAALRYGRVCAPFTRYGPIETWAGYTTGAIGPTLAFSSHPSPPTDDPTIFGLNVPSRVANYVACGMAQSETLRDPATWHLDVTWEDR